METKSWDCQGLGGRASGVCGGNVSQRIQTLGYKMNKFCGSNVQILTIVNKTVLYT